VAVATIREPVGLLHRTNVSHTAIKYPRKYTCAFPVKKWAAWPSHISVLFNDCSEVTWLRSSD